MNTHNIGVYRKLVKLSLNYHQIHNIIYSSGYLHEISDLETRDYSLYIAL